MAERNYTPGYFGIAANAFMDGYDRIKRHEAAEEERIYRRKRDAIADFRYREQQKREQERYNETQAWREKDWDRNEERHKEAEKWKTSQWDREEAWRKQDQKQAAEDRVENARRWNLQEGREAERWTKEQEAYAEQKAMRQAETEAAQIKNREARGKLDREDARRSAWRDDRALEERMAKLKSQPLYKTWQGFLEDDGKVDYKEMRTFLAEQHGIDLMAVLDDQAEQHLQTALTFMNGDSDMRITDKRLAEAFNYFWQPGLNKGLGEKTKDGKEIIHKEVDRIVPGKQPGTVALLLNVSVYNPLTDQIEEYQAPATDGGRSVNDDQVKQIPADEMMRNIVGVAHMREELDAYPRRKAEFKDRYMRNMEAPMENIVTGMPTDMEYQSDIDGFVSASTGQARGLDGKPVNPAAVAGKKMNMGADVNLVTFFFENRTEEGMSEPERWAEAERLAIAYKQNARGRSPLEIRMDIEEMVQDAIAKNATLMGLAKRAATGDNSAKTELATITQTLRDHIREGIEQDVTAKPEPKAAPKAAPPAQAPAAAPVFLDSEDAFSPY